MRRVPVMCSVTITDRSGRTLSGQTIEAFYNSVSHADLLYVGVNCALGADEMRPYVEDLARVASEYTGCFPNAGLPNEFGEYDETPAIMAGVIREFAEAGWLNLAGGCCGTRPEHIAAIAEAVRGLPPRTRATPAPFTRLSGLEPLTITPDSNFTMIGERTNVTGSRRFRRLIMEDKYEDALEVARQQVAGGANIIDVCMDEGMLDAEAAMTRFLNLIAAEPDISRVPVMIDSSKFSVLEAGLKCIQGKGVVNSISLKEGEEELKRQARIIRRYGAAVVVMGFDETGQATTVEHKLAIAKRAYRILTEEVGFPPQDIIFDPNILTVATGIEEHNEYAVNFIEAVREIKKAMPLCKVSGGVSNISFSFRGNNPVREAMHAAFLYHAIRAGLDMAIVNAGQLAVYDEIPAELRDRVEDVLFNRNPDATEVLVDMATSFKGQKKKDRGHAGMAPAAARRPSGPRSDPGHHRIRRCRRRRGARKVRAPAPHHRRSAHGRYEHRRRPLWRRQNVLAPGGQERAGDEKSSGHSRAIDGRRKGQNRAIIEQGQDGHCHGQGRRSRHRQEHRRRRAALQRLYEVIDLGVMVPARTILETAQKEEAEIIGLSGLITPSLDEMIHVAKELERLEMKVPLLIGGATTSSKHTAVKIAPHYSGVTAHVRDASLAVGVMGKLTSDEHRESFAAENADRQESLRQQFERNRNARPLLSLAQARERRTPIEWKASEIAQPAFVGVRPIELTIADLAQ